MGSMSDGEEEAADGPRIVELSESAEGDPRVHVPRIGDVVRGLEQAVREAREAFGPVAARRLVMAVLAQELGQGQGDAGEAL